MQEMTIVQTIAICALPVLFAIIGHEVAHGWVAYKFGDQTAKLAGRLTLNPISHIDLVGTILVPIIMLMAGGFIFGWAKPVPVDARNMHNPKTDMAIVAVAGPMSNLLMALFWAGVEKIGLYLLPIEGWFSQPLIYMGNFGITINIVLAVLNFLPIPPLDGGRVVSNLASGRLAWYMYRIEPYGFFILVLLMLSGMLSLILKPIVFFFMYWITVLFGLPL